MISTDWRPGRMSARRPGPAAVLLLLLGCAVPVAAQSAAPAAGAPAEPPPWTGSVGAGLALTAGNTETSTLNFSFDLSSNPEARHFLKAEALYLRGDKDGETTVNRTAVKIRDKYDVTPRAFVFGQLAYLRDTFKSIQFLWAPTAGAGFTVFEDDRTAFAVDAGMGLIFEKNPLRNVKTSGAVTAGEDVTIKLSEASSITQAFDALWVLDDVGDALYTAKAGIVAAITSRSQLKLEVVDTFKTRPPSARTRRNDVAIVTSIVYKF